MYINLNNFIAILIFKELILSFYISELNYKNHSIDCWLFLFQEKRAESTIFLLSFIHIYTLDLSILS